MSSKVVPVPPLNHAQGPDPQPEVRAGDDSLLRNAFEVRDVDAVAAVQALTETDHCVRTRAAGLGPGERTEANDHGRLRCCQRLGGGEAGARSRRKAAIALSLGISQMPATRARAERERRVAQSLGRHAQGRSET